MVYESIITYKNPITTTPIPTTTTQPETTTWTTMTIPWGSIPSVYQQKPIEPIPETHQSIINREYAKLSPLEAFARSTSVSILSFPSMVEQGFSNLLSGKLPQGGSPYYLASKSAEESIKNNFRPSPQVAEWEYQLKGLNAPEKFVAVQTKWYEDVILPLAGGAAFKYISLGEKVATAGSLTEKAYAYFVRPTQAVIQYGVVPATIGTDIGLTAAANKSQALGGFGSKEVLGKIGTLGWQFGLMGVGYKYAPEKYLDIKFDITRYEDTGIISAQKYVDFGKLKLPVSRMKYMDINKSVGFNEFGEPIGEPKGLAVPWSEPIRSQQGNVIISQYGKTTYVSPIVEGMSKISVKGMQEPYMPTGKELSTKVWPKPIVNRAYETYFIFVDVTPIAEYYYNKMFGVKISSKPNYLYSKSKIVDMGKVFRDQEKAFDLIGGQTQSGGTKTILKPPIVEQVKIVTPILEQEQLQVPESLQVGITRIMQEQESLSDLYHKQHPFYALGQITKTNQKQMQKSLLGFNYGTTQYQEQVSDSIQLLNFEQAQQQIQLQMQNQNQKYQHDLIFDQSYVYDIYDENFNKKTTKTQNTIKENRMIKRKKWFDYGDVSQDMAKAFKGYNVLIKEQYIFGGVKTKYPQYQKINMQPLTKESAYSLLATKLKQTARASGKIESIEIQGQPKKQRFAYDWLDVVGEFYEKQGIVIQKASKRIGTPGELKEITYKGIQARRRR